MTSALASSSTSLNSISIWQELRRALVTNLGLVESSSSILVWIFVLQELRRFPGRGARLIVAGLKSPVVRNRNMAVAALAACQREEWPSGLAKSLELAGKIEPDKGVMEGMRKVLRGENIIRMRGRHADGSISMQWKSAPENPN
jgi:hypothetical protein